MQRQIKRINLKLTKEQKNALEMNKGIYKSFQGLDKLTWEQYFCMISEEVSTHVKELVFKHGN